MTSDHETPAATVADSYPRESARTRRYTLGAPRNIVVSPDGRRIVFLRSRGGVDPLTCLWVADARTGDETLVADPLALLGSEDDAELPAAERARRERLRESAAGITAFATDGAVTVAAFALNGRLFVAGLISGSSRELAVDGPVFDPRPDPTARRVAYVSGPTLRIATLDGSSGVLAGDGEPDTISWGSAEFVAAEEIGRHRGFWWSPDGDQLAVARVDTDPVERWFIADPAAPERPAIEQRYPAAGTPNAEVSLHVIGLDGDIVDVEWDRGALEYLTAVHWDDTGLSITVQSRDQRRVALLDVDPATGATTERWTDEDEQWVELVPGVPRVTADGVVAVADRDGARRLLIDDEPVTPPDLQVRGIATLEGPGVLFTANRVDDATDIQVWRWLDGELTALTDEPGVHQVAGGGGTIVITTATLAEPGAQTETLDGVEIASLALTPSRRAEVGLHVVGERRLAAAVLLPDGHDGSPLPVLLDPYGGPHAARVTRAHNAHLGSQWFADQGFAVVVIDGRGTPGRGSAWERAVHHDFVNPVLDDQVDGLHALAGELDGVLDLSRVAIRGWSFGGYLAALAVLRRPDVFHAAIAGAPVTEWRLYDTHYTERYLGDPNARPDVYDANSLLPLAGELTRPLLLIHGLADDNVVAAHTLRLSSALLAGGRHHEVLPLVGVTHMTPQEVVAENLLRHQLEFLRRSLGCTPGLTPTGTAGSASPPEFAADPADRRSPT